VLLEVPLELLFSLPAMLLCLSGVYAVFTLMLAAAVIRYPRITYLRLWFGVFLFGAAGGGLMALRGELPAYATDYIGLGLIVAGIGFVWLGMRSFFNRYAPYFLLVMIVLGVVPLGYALEGSQELAALARTVYALAVAALFYLLTAWELRRSIKEEGLPSAFAASAVYRSFGIMHLLVLPLPFIFPVQFDGLVPDSIWLSGLVFLSLLHTIAAVFLGIVLSNERMAKAMRKLADTDELTGLANRRSFLRQVEKSLATGAGGTLLIADIDHFKQINDRYGHQGGDAVLQGFAVLLQQLAGERFVAARIGGEEFGIFLPGLSGPHLDLLAAQLCRAAALLQTEHAGEVIPVTISAGLAGRSSSVSYEQLFGEADKALYLAKRSGRNCFRRLPAASPADEGIASGKDELATGTVERAFAKRKTA
jgi:diguanylate cyclase (GGDEF)-like protein